MKSKRILLLAFIFLIPLVLILTQCSTLFGNKADPRGPMYAGAESCKKCHAEISDSYFHTAHFQSTRPSSAATTKGSFNIRYNNFVFNSTQKVVMEKREDGLYQVGYEDGKKVEEHRFDITFGGVKAETYLYWNNNKIYQLPISYFDKLRNWTNSPGYDSSHMDFGRIIGKRCFECHASYIKELPLESQSLQQEISFDKATLINGVDCERCHGPGANHVNFHTTYPEQKKPKYMAQYSSLTRQQRIDMCAVCHSGNKNMVIGSTFPFKPGDNLNDFIEPDFSVQHTDAAMLDVHGNQSQMLATSQCFMQSKMDCANCHNTHAKERGSTALFSQRCMSCHKESDHTFCKMAPQIGTSIKNNCIDCHMPERASSIISVQTSGKGNASPYMVRTHRIAIYADATEKILAFLKKK